MERRVEVEVGALAVAQLRLIEDGVDPSRLAERLLRDYVERWDRGGDELRRAAAGLLANARPDDEQSDIDHADLAEVRCVIAMPELSALCEQRGIRLGVGPGWARIVSAAIERIWAVDPEAVITQVKQKFGDLDINFARDPSSDRDAVVADVVAGARREAAATCELCGLTGSIRSDRPYVEPLCDAHSSRSA